MPYSKVERQVWHDEKFRHWDRDTRDVWLYLLTCPHSNRVGLFVLDLFYAAADLQLPPEVVERALGVLCEQDRIAYDKPARLVFIVNHLKHNPLANPNVVTAAAAELFELPFQQRLFERLLEAVEAQDRTTTGKGLPFYSLLSDAIRKRLGRADLNRSGNGLANHSGNGMPNPEPEQEQELEETPSLQRAHTGHEKLAELRAYLGQRGHAADRMAGSTGHPPSWASAVLGLYGPNGTDTTVWGGVPPPERPAALAMALDRYAGEAREYHGRLFRRFLQSVIEERANGNHRAGPGGQVRGKAASGNGRARDKYSHLVEG